jgi:hypothetical protein
MSALGQQRTYAPQQAMSALPSIVTEKADMRRISECCGQKRTSPALFDHFVGACEYRRRNGEAQRLRCL